MDPAVTKFLLEGIVLPIVVVGTLMYILIQRKRQKQAEDESDSKKKEKL